MYKDVVESTETLTIGGQGGEKSSLEGPIITRCSSFFRLSGGWSCRTRSASSFSISSVRPRTAFRFSKMLDEPELSAASTSSDQLNTKRNLDVKGSPL